MLLCYLRLVPHRTKQHFSLVICPTVCNVFVVLFFIGCIRWHLTMHWTNGLSDYRDNDLSG